MTDPKQVGPLAAPVSSKPLAWIVRDAETAPAGASVLDLACGGGRHGRAYLERGCAVTFVDIKLDGVADLRDRPHATLIKADLESRPWPLEGRHFDRVVVANYLWRPLLPRIVASVAPGGALLYQTFARGNEAYGRPTNPDYLLQEDELAEACAPDLIVEDAFHGFVDDPKPAKIQRVLARRPNVA
ncbi:MAG: class I SAM-dependent methyltransferase [Alphaproteobacteria bacterium]|nr:class I SAM-dependent methyltransferase [Alphaproteobacteria bacterium]